MRFYQTGRCRGEEPPRPPRAPVVIEGKLRPRAVCILTPIASRAKRVYSGAMNDDKARLESWKEIADFFNVSVRTVQGWEVEKAMPVRTLQRLPKTVCA